MIRMMRHSGPNLSGKDRLFFQIWKQDWLASARQTWTPEPEKPVPQPLKPGPFRLCSGVAFPVGSARVLR